MINNIIIGAGFSAGIVKGLFNKKIKIIGCLDHSFLSKFSLANRVNCFVLATQNGNNNLAVF